MEKPCIVGPRKSIRVIITRLMHNVKQERAQYGPLPSQRHVNSIGPHLCLANPCRSSCKCVISSLTASSTLSVGISHSIQPRLIEWYRPDGSAFAHRRTSRKCRSAPSYFTGLWIRQILCYHFVDLWCLDSLFASPTACPTSQISRRAHRTLAGCRPRLAAINFPD